LGFILEELLENPGINFRFQMGLATSSPSASVGAASLTAGLSLPAV
jgi:hypothetical protein